MDVRWDLCTICQLDCPECYMRLGESDVTAGYVTTEKFKEITGLPVTNLAGFKKLPDIYKKRRPWEYVHVCEQMIFSPEINWDRNCMDVVQIITKRGISTL